MGISFQKAKREQLWTKVIMTGPSGSGKTYSSLRLATGLAKACSSRIAYIDTENGRARYYANEFEFDDIQLSAPYAPQKYLDCIDAAIEGGYKVIIIDSLSHEWLWCNDTVNSMPGNSFQNWGKVKTKYHNPFMEKILQSPIHIIATARGKDKWTLEEKDGKKTPKKVGEGSVQSDDTEYNYTVAFNLSQDTHIANCTKDNTHIFEDRYTIITEQDGEALYKWANTGDTPVSKPANATRDEVLKDDAAKLIEKIRSIVNDKIATGIPKTAISSILKAEIGTARYTSVVDVGLLEKGLSALENMEG